MVKKICFFSSGFAFNRLRRMWFYEKIFPKDVEIFLFTTNKYKGKEKENYQYKWDLKRTKIVTVDYNPFKLGFTLRKFCKENDIDRVINIGNYFGSSFSLIATIFTKTDYLLNKNGALNRYDRPLVVHWMRILWLWLLILFSKKTILVDRGDYQRQKKIWKFFLQPGNKFQYLAAPVNTGLFRPKNKKDVRKRLKLPLKKKIVIFVGRVTIGKGSKALIELIKRNKDIFFIVIGRLVDKEFLELKGNNFIYYEKKNSKELLDFYNAADIGFFLHTSPGGGLGMTTEESLACGVPAVVPIRKDMKQSPSIIQIPPDIEESDVSVKNFFKLSEKKKRELSKIARIHAKKYYSYNALKYDYCQVYLTPKSLIKKT